MGIVNEGVVPKSGSIIKTIMVIYIQHPACSHWWLFFLQGADLMCSNVIH